MRNKFGACFNVCIEVPHATFYILTPNKMILQPTNVELTKVYYYDKNKKDRNGCVSTISREVFDNKVNKNLIIKNNIFGHRWVLKINDAGSELKTKKSKLRVIVYVLVFCSIIVAVSFGIFFSLEKYIFKNVSKEDNTPKLSDKNQTEVLIFSNKTINWNHTHETQINSSIMDHENKTKNTTANAEDIEKTKNTQTGYVDSKNTNAQIYSLPTPKKYCENCIPHEEICLKIEETDIPKCVKPLVKEDPTGCGGFCLLNTQYCHVLHKEESVYQCLSLRNLFRCPEDTFNCGNMCISIENRCDGILHCSNDSDELDCDCILETHFQCGNSTSCLTNAKKCDGKVDCWDRSDETDCPEIACQKGQIPCGNNRCIPMENFCDGHFDCSDKSDEPLGCHT